MRELTQQRAVKDHAILKALITRENRVEFSIRALAPQGAKTGCLVLGVYQSADGGAPALSRAAAAADKSARGRLSSILAHGDLRAKAGATLLLHGIAGLAAERVLLVGLGEQKNFAEGPFRDAVRGAAAALRELGARDAVAYFADLKVGRRPMAWNLRHAALGLREAFYRFDQLKTQKKLPAPALAAVTLATQAGPVAQQARDALREAAATADGVALARTLGNLPPNICTPSYLAEEAKKLARQFKLGLEVLERRDMERLKMGALLAVTRGSHQAPKLIVLRYSGGAKGKAPLVLVGKGITFDTGGISLKPAGEMDEMKYDMSGAGSVLGALRALAGMQAPVNVIGVVPTCENMPGGQASRPGDVVTTMSGQTVEILNTDAEGRLILCDALTYVERFKPDAVVDIATLTGACVIALGHIATGMFANDERLAQALRTAGEDAWDRVWPMPLWEDYQEQLRSNFADMANIGGRPAGSVTAACYLSRFAKKLRWAHLDIAGTAWKSGREKGSTGRPVPLLVRFALASAGR
jgi:leucyl aminopeptidase